MKAGLAILLLLLLAVAVGYGLFWLVRAGLRKHRQYKNRTADWTVELDSDGQNTMVLLTHPDEPHYEIDRIPINLPHWEYQEDLEAAKITARDKADALNRSLP
jgi:hypothetical protein